MDTYRLSYTVEGITYSFECQFTIPSEDIRNEIVFIEAIKNHQRIHSYLGRITHWEYIRISQ